jgi:hypothetical protein
MDYDLGKITGRAAVLSAIESGNGGSRRISESAGTMRTGGFVMCPMCLMIGVPVACYAWQMMVYQSAVSRQANARPTVRLLTAEPRAFSRN